MMNYKAKVPALPHKEVCSAYMPKEHHLNVIDEYIDDGWSGTNFERPSFQRMIEDIEAGKIDLCCNKRLISDFAATIL